MLAWWSGMSVCTGCSSTLPASCNSPRTLCSYLGALSDAPQARETEHTRVYLRPAVHAGEARVYTLGSCDYCKRVCDYCRSSRQAKSITWPCRWPFFNWPVYVLSPSESYWVVSCGVRGDTPAWKSEHRRVRVRLRHGRQYTHRGRRNRRTRSWTIPALARLVVRASMSRAKREQQERGRAKTWVARADRQSTHGMAQQHGLQDARAGERSGVS